MKEAINNSEDEQPIQSHAVLDDLGIENFIKTINEEEKQERASEAPNSSFFDKAPPQEMIIQRVREYDDITKHYVRREVWLKSVKKLSQENGGAGIKLLTLPGRHRLEVGLYAKEKLLAPTKLGDGSEALSVVGFENSPEQYGLLKFVSPKFLDLFNEDLVATLSEPGSKAHKNLIRYFPFDVINLDLTSNLVIRAEGPYGPVLAAVRETIRLQGAQYSDWILMLTFRAGLPETDKEALEILKKEFQDNLRDHPAVKAACHTCYGSTDADALLMKHPEEMLGQFAAKWITDQAHKQDWQVKEMRHVGYDRKYDRGGEEHTYSIRKLVFRFGRNRLPSYDMPGKHDPTTKWHIDDLIKVVSRRADDVDKKLEKLVQDKPEFLDILIAEIESLKRETDAQLYGEDGGADAGTETSQD